MTRLLVSVRDVDEARAALAGGAAIIDIKEPSQGSLGAADPSQWPHIQQVVGGRVPLSAALGELLHSKFMPGDSPRSGGEHPLHHAAGLTWVKVGLAGCQAWPDWPCAWQRIAQALPMGVSLVAAAYADWRAAAAPSISTVLEMAQSRACRVLLIDTWSKAGGCLLDHLAEHEAIALCREVQSRGMQLALAGSLTSEQLPFIRKCAPDYLAVRGAVCRGSRVAAVDEHLVRQLSSELKKTKSCASQPAHRGA
jgi:uncharacterized protein (UPF0264 family)